MHPDTDFFVVAHEPGAEHPALPTWANHGPNPAGLAPARASAAERIDIDDVPGAFQLLNVLDARECQALMRLTEACGYLPDAAVSLPRAIRHNDNMTWVADEVTAHILWQRCAHAVNQAPALFQGRRAVGLNARFRFYRYATGDYFAPHTDGAWPGSKVAEGKLVTDAYGDRWSQLSFVLFLNDAYVGGSTGFYVSATDPTRPARKGEAAVEVSIRTPTGAALCFPHGLHPLHCLHRSESIVSGTKYIMRTDVLVKTG